MELKTPAEVYMATALAVVVADGQYSSGEAMEIWHHIEDLPIFEGKDFLSMQNDVLKRFDKEQINEAFSDDELAVIFTAANNLLDAEQHQTLLRIATSVANADQAGHEAEKALLAKIRTGLKL